MKKDEGVWLRGNLHMHTNRSDGRLAPEEAIAMYEQGGYDFIAVTDHWVYHDGGKTEKGMLLLSGCEYDVGEDVVEGLYHIVSIGAHEKPQIAKREDLGPQEIIDAINASGGLAILAHPAWSLNSPETVRKMHGIFGTEIYNTTCSYACSFSNARPYSGIFVDQLAARGILLPCVASDDAHRYDMDPMKSYVMVHAKAKTAEAIMEALRAGNFYATQGPEISMVIEHGIAKVRCSPASYVIFHSNAAWNPQRVTMGEHITEASCTIKPNETFIRAEVVDAQGRMAFTSPVKVQG